MDRGTHASGRTIAQKLDHLIVTIHPAGRGPLSYMEIAEGIRKKAGPEGQTVSHATIQKIRKGEITDPKVSTLTVIAGFFGVPVTYFLDDAVTERVDAKLARVKERVELTRAQRELVEMLEDGDVRDVAVRMNGLSVGSLRAIRGVIEQARKLEGLPDAPPRGAEGDSPATGASRAAGASNTGSSATGSSAAGSSGAGAADPGAPDASGTDPGRRGE